jgi:DNA polymerase III subunit delta
VSVCARDLVGLACHDEPVAESALDDISFDGTIPALVLVVGDDEFLAARAIEQVSAAARRADPDIDVVERGGADVGVAELTEMVSPSLFGGRRLVVITDVQDLRAAVVEPLARVIRSGADDLSLVLQHTGGAKGKAVLTTGRALRATEISSARLTRPDERLAFVRSEVRRAGGSITPDAAALLLDAVGSDLRELSTAAVQLVGDSGGRIDAAAVTAYHRGRAEVSGFAVADRAVLGDVAGALETLRWALSIGVPHVVIADALAEGVRTVARVTAAGRGNPYQLAQRLAMPPWKVKRALSQARGWSDPGLRLALEVVAELNADVKGVAVDPGYALERAIARLRDARAAEARGG